AHDDRIQGNLISANKFGVVLGAGYSGPADAVEKCTVTGNTIGSLNSKGVPLGNRDAGIGVQASAKNCTITGNTIAYSGTVPGDDGTAAVVVSLNAPGVWLTPEGGNPTGIRIQGNSIYDNTGLGIDLSASAYPALADGVTVNDPGDGDDGPNNLQNYP